jgi:phage terminase large subunit-like protein
MEVKLSALILSSQAYRFADDVVTNKLVSGKRRKQACRRFIDELKRSEDTDYPWRFNIEKAYRPIDFIERFLVPTKGNYTKMELLPWQHFIEANLYGWVDKKTGYRRFREGLILVGSGNGKSTLVTGNAIYGVSKDGERGAEVYCLANSRDQAKVIFNEAKAQIEMSPALVKHFDVTKSGIFYPKTKSVIEPLSSESKNLDGKNVHMAIFDELQEYRDYKLINVIKPKTKKRRQALLLYISTFGTVIDGPLMDYYLLGCNILDKTEAVSTRAADRMFVYIDEIDETDDPDCAMCWAKANPSLGVLLKIEDLVDEWERCKAVPAERSNFINKQLNVFTQVDELSFLDIKTIQANNRELDIVKLEGERCYGGFDMSETEDFTSACLEFPLEDNCFFILEHSWTTQRKMNADREKLDWRHLSQNGYLTIVQGNYVDHGLIFDWFMEMGKKYVIDGIGYDPAKAYELIKRLRQEGFPLDVVRQGELTLTAPLDNLKERFLDGKVVHNNNPMFNWYLGNIKLTKRSVNATYLPTKQNAYRKIDGFAALLCAHTEFMRKEVNYISPDKDVATVIDLNQYN